MENFGLLGRLVDATATGGVYGLGWLLFLYMLVRERYYQKRYADLVYHIVAYFTKVNVVESGESNEHLFQLPRALRQGIQRLEKDKSEII